MADSKTVKDSGDAKAANAAMAKNVFVPDDTKEAQASGKGIAELTADAHQKVRDEEAWATHRAEVLPSHLSVARTNEWGISLNADGTPHNAAGAARKASSERGATEVSKSDQAAADKAEAASVKATEEAHQAVADSEAHRTALAETTVPLDQQAIHVDASGNVVTDSGEEVHPAKASVVKSK